MPTGGFEAVSEELEDLSALRWKKERDLKTNSLQRRERRKNCMK